MEAAGAALEVVEISTGFTSLLPMDDWPSQIHQWIDADNQSRHIGRTSRYAARPVYSGRKDRMKSATQTAAPAVAPNLAAIAGHPTRLRCWFLLAERTMSPKELAAEIGQSVTHVAYHVRELLKLSAIELIKTEPRRGATEHWYRTVTRPDMRIEDVRKLAKHQSHQNAGHIVQLQLADAAASFDAEVMVERPEHALIRYPVDFDEQAFAEASELMDETLERLYEIQNACVERTTGSPESRDIPAMAHLNLFEMPPGTTVRPPRPIGGNE